MSGGKEEGQDKRNSLETFDGSDASLYRRWRRKAELYLMGLPTTVPESRWGPRLLEHVAGEAEEALEHLDVHTITSDKGYKEVFKVLDDKYKELDKDDMQRCLKEYFYAATIKPNETYRNFVTRVDTAYRGLQRHKIELPDEVRGWIVLRKLALDSTSEALVMTSTKGSLKYAEVVQALKAVFPNGKGSSNIRSKDKDVFLASEERMTEVDGQAGTPEEAFSVEEPAEVMEVISNQLHEVSDYESEDALEIFETYANVRKKCRKRRCHEDTSQLVEDQNNGNWRAQ